MIVTDVPAPTPEQLAEQYRAARLRIAGLLAGLRPEQEALTVPACPDWTVQQLASHLAGVPADLVARRNPTGDTQAWVDGQVAARAERTTAEVLAEWDEVGPAFEDLIARKPASFAGLTYDVVAHEHDLRATLARPGEREGEGVLVALGVGFALLDADLARHGLGAVRLVGSGHEWRVGDGAPTLSLETSAFELFRLLGSRRSRTQLLAAPWVGDVERCLPALAHMPLPAADLVE